MKFECCFCGRKIDSKKENITSLLVTTNWEQEEEMQQSQQIFCHLNCLKTAMNHPNILFVEDFGL